MGWPGFIIIKYSLVLLAIWKPGISGVFHVKHGSVGFT